MKNIKTWRERADERGIGSCESRDEEITELRAKLKQQTELVEKCMVAMNENADIGEKAEARLAALESQEPVAAIHVNHINGESSAILFNRIALHHGDNLYAAAGAEPGDIRALKRRIHELEGEVIGYKRILSDSEAKAPVMVVYRDERDALKAENAAFEPFLKEGETPLERFTRERKDGDALLKIYGKALTDIESLKAENAAISAEFAGMASAVSHLSALVDEQHRLLIELNSVFGSDSYGIVFEDGDSELIDKVRTHLAGLAPLQTVDSTLKE